LTALSSFRWKASFKTDSGDVHIIPCSRQPGRILTTDKWHGFIMVKCECEGQFTMIYIVVPTWDPKNVYDLKKNKANGTNVLTSVSARKTYRVKWGSGGTRITKVWAVCWQTWLNDSWSTTTCVLDCNYTFCAHFQHLLQSFSKHFLLKYIWKIWLGGGNKLIYLTLRVNVSFMCRTRTKEA
jgi:hypothetical protein